MQYLLMRFTRNNHHNLNDLQPHHFCLPRADNILLIAFTLPLAVFKHLEIIIVCFLQSFSLPELIIQSQGKMRCYCCSHEEYKCLDCAYVQQLPLTVCVCVRACCNMYFPSAHPFLLQLSHTLVSVHRAVITPRPTIDRVMIVI